MPRQHNQRIREIQRQKKYSEDLKEAMLTLAGAFFVVMCLWGATEFAEWLGQIIHENQMYKVGQQIESSQLYVRLTADRMQAAKDKAAQDAYIKQWQEKNGKLAGIFNAR